MRIVVLSTHQVNLLRSWILIVLSIAFHQVIYGQNSRVGDPPIANFTRSNYNAGTQNWAVKQNTEGIIFVGNNKGLLKFDGSNWELLRLPNSTIVRSLDFAGDSIIFIGAQNEFGYIRGSSLSDVKYNSLKYLVPKSRANFEDVWKTVVRDDGVYFCTERAVFLISKGACKVIDPPSGRFENFFEVNGELYLQDKVDGLFKYEDNKLKVILNEEIVKNDRIVSLLSLGDGGDKLLILTEEVLGLNDLGLFKWNSPDILKVIKNKPYCGLKLEDGNYAIGTIQDGIFIISEDGEIMSHINTDRGLMNNTVLCIYEDRQNNLWLGLDNGLAYVEISSPFSLIGSNLGVDGTGYASFIHDSMLYLGTNQGLYAREWSSDYSNMNEYFDPVNGFEGQIWGINEIDQNLIINRHSGAFYFNPDEGDSRPISRVEGVWDFRELDHYPGYAIEGTYSGFYIYKRDSTDRSKWILKGKLQGFEESARIFEEDKNGDIWASHSYRGLYRLKLGDDPTDLEEVKLYDHKRGLPSDIFNNVSKIRNEIIFATPHGVYSYEEARDTFLVHETLTEIIGEDRDVERFIEDEIGNVWFSVGDEFGMIKVREEGVYNELEVRYFNQMQDALVDGFEHVYSYDKQNTFIGTEKGFVHYDPTIEKVPAFPFALKFRDIQVYSAQDSTLFLTGGLIQSFKEPVRFDSDLNNLICSFVAPNYELLNRIDYRYKLEGYYQDWSKWDSKTEKEYTSLPPGEYTFLVEARNAYGAKSNPIGFAFTVSEPWYARTEAKIAYFIAFLFLIFMIFRFVDEKEKRKTEQFKTEHVERLELKEAEFQETVERSENEIIRLKNEKLRNEIAHKNSELASATMHLVQKGEILMKIKADLHKVAEKAPSDLVQPIKRIERAIESDVRLDKNWERFESHFDQVHENFFQRLRQNHPELTPKDQKLCAYLRMNLTTKEIAPLLNISVRGVEISRYRLRKKLNLNPDQNLVSFILEL